MTGGPLLSTGGPNGPPVNMLEEALEPEAQGRHGPQGRHDSKGGTVPRAVRPPKSGTAPRAARLQGRYGPKGGTAPRAARGITSAV